MRDTRRQLVRRGGFGSGIIALDGARKAAKRLLPLVKEAAKEYWSNKRYKSAPVMSGPVADNGVIFSKSKRTIGKKRKHDGEHAFRSMLRTHAKRVTRWQVASTNLLGPGKLPLALGNAKLGETADRNWKCTPIMFMSLTDRGDSHRAFNLVNNNAGAYSDGLNRLFMNSATGSWKYVQLDCETATGTNSNGPEPQPIAFSGHQAPTLIGASFHKWTNIKLALYGAKNYPLTYRIYIVSMDKPWHPTGHGPGIEIQEDKPFARWMRDWLRKLTNNPICDNNDVSEWRKHIKIHHYDEIRINPLSYGDASAEASETGVNVGNVRMHKIFLTHDRYRDYNWYRQPETVVDHTNLAVNQTDVVGEAAPYGGVSDVEFKKRLVMFITCSAPSFDAESIMYAPETRFPEVPSTSLPAYAGSFDINVTKSFRDGPRDDYEMP